MSEIKYNYPVENLVELTGGLKSGAADGVLTITAFVKDDQLNKTQREINEEVASKLSEVVVATDEEIKAAFAS